jgi:dienelactone hydrolase
MKRGPVHSSCCLTTGCAAIAALTYDKRGVGRSQGSYSTVGPGSSERTLGTLADDALAGVAFLKAQRDIRWTRIGLVGLSQGGWIAPLAASRTADVAFMVLYSSPAVSVGEEIYFSDLTGDQGGSTDLTDPEIARLLAAYDGPRGFDPRQVLMDIDVPGLWLLGERDRSIPVPETTAILRELQSAGRPFAFEVFEGADHSLRDGPGSLVDSWPVVHDWLSRVGVLQ